MEIEKECPETLSWTILQNDPGETGDCQYVSFVNDILHKFAAASYITREIEKAQDKKV